MPEIIMATQKGWKIAKHMPYLLAIREKMGWVYGSDDLCVFLYSMVKRQRPKLVIELGTGLGVSTVWMAAAMRENSIGQLHTFDNGSHFIRPSMSSLFDERDGLLGPLAIFSEENRDISRFIEMILLTADVQEYVTFHAGDINLSELVSQPTYAEGIDMLFSDFDHGPDMIMELLARFLPLLRPAGSIFIDSASTHRMSYLVLERAIDALNSRKIPSGIAHYLSEAKMDSLDRRLRSSRLILTHLIERQDRPQNSTSWIQLEPLNMSPGLATNMHG
jgi:predicted O-methyltransferase YrrM